LDTLDPGQTFTLAYSLSGLERGDWTDTDVFFRGSQDVIGATKMDEKLLDEIRRREEVLADEESQEVDGDIKTDDKSDGDESDAPVEEESPRTTGQQTLMGYGSDA
jgi:hypothetical protein